MPPKGKEPPKLEVPEVEEELVVPDEIGPVLEPSFCLVLGHLESHTFVVEEPDDDAMDAPKAPPTLFDLPAALFERAKQAEDLLTRRVIVLEREGLQSRASEEGHTLARALRLRLHKEREARSRLKLNAVRRRAIEDFSRERAEDAGEEAARPPAAEPLETGPQADFVLLVRGYPANAAEIGELAAENLSLDGVVDLWAQIYFAGEHAEGGPEDMVPGNVETPHSVMEFYNEIQSAPLGSELSECTILTVFDSNDLAYPPLGGDPEVTQGERVYRSMLQKLDTEVVTKDRYRKWLKDVDRVKAPAQKSEEDVCETRLYSRLMSSVDPSHHDVPLFLHCLTEQVQLDIEGSCQKLEDEVALSSLKAYLCAAHDDVLAFGDGGAPRPKEPAGSRPATGAGIPPPAEAPTLLPVLDAAACTHHLGGGGTAASLADVGGVPGRAALDAVCGVLEKLSAPGVGRSNLPSSTVYSAGQRDALQSRFHPFAPELSPAELEQLFVVHKFEELMVKAQPERKWDLSDRVCRERIPPKLLAQTLSVACQSEALMDMAYVPRYDALLVALHWRTLQGNAAWHSWRGDLLGAQDAERWRHGLCTTPTYNDWATVLRGRSGEVPQPRRLLEATDARKLGYAGCIEKFATPDDGSTILASLFEHGVASSFSMPSNVQPVAEVSETLTAYERESDAQSCVGPVEPSRPARYDVPPLRSSRAARVMKGGCAFGITTDESWTSWQKALLSPESVLPFEDTELGEFWVSLPGRARCTARMHHERTISAFDVELPERLPPLGVVFSYTMAIGQVVQVFSDGAVRLSWPLELRHESAKNGDATASGVSRSAEAAGDGNRHFVPGCSEDVERSRTVMPLGTIVRKLLSGRVEILHPDGTTTTRNPTTAELEAQLQSLTRARVGPHRLEFLRRLLHAQKLKTVSLSEAPSEKEKATGLPGHWVVVRSDGRVFGRMLPTPKPVEEVAPTEEDVGEAAEPADDAAAAAADLFGGYLIEDGALVEYEISLVSQALQEDLQSKHKTLTNERGLASFQDPEGTQNLCVHADGTQVMCTRRQGGRDTVVSKEPFALITCEIDDASACVRVSVECADGARIDVVPQAIQGGQLEALGPNDPDFAARSMHANVVLRCQADVAVVSTGTGEVRVLFGAEMESLDSVQDDSVSCYVARCDENRLYVTDASSSEYVLHGDQTLSLPTLAAQTEDGELKSPRCLASATLATAKAAEGLGLPAKAPPPRLFLIFGDGSAEELLTNEVVDGALEAARSEAMATVVDDQPIFPEGGPFEANRLCKCYTVFRERFADTCVMPPPPNIAMPEGLELASSIYSMATSSQHFLPGAQATPSALTEFRQFLRYPSVDEDTLKKFRGSLKQYRAWEMELLLKEKKALEGPDTKAKKDTKKDKKVDAKLVRDKTKKPSRKMMSRMQKEQEEEATSMEAIPDIFFVEDLKLTAFEHEAASLAFRAAKTAELGSEALLAAAVAARHPEEEVAEADVLEEFIGDDAEDAFGEGPSADAFAADGPEAGAEEAAFAEAAASGCAVEDAAYEGLASEVVANSHVMPARRKGRDPAGEAPVFAYFASESGLSFLLETGEIERGPTHQKTRQQVGSLQNGRRAQVEAVRGAWNPRLVGEAVPYEEERQQQQARGDMDALQEEAEGGAEEGYDDAHYDGYGGDGGAAGVGGVRGSEQMPFNPMARPPPYSHEQPRGPHPDKRGSEWDIYGEAKSPKKAVSQAYVAINQDYLEIEGATDRRVRTVSVAQKKNAAKAPSVSEIRKTGIHAIGRTAALSAKDILGDGIDAVEEHWKLSSTMQGLGNSNSLVDVRPGACRFGPLRKDSLYSMSFYFRNLDVDVTRFSVSKVKSQFDFVTIQYQPGHLAPGMAAKVTVLVSARAPAKIEQLVEVRIKAHVVRVPVTARVFDAEEYDRLDAESLALHGRRIGRHRERSSDNKPGPVSLVTDPGLYQQIMGCEYKAPPHDFVESVYS